MLEKGFFQYIRSIEFDSETVGDLSEYPFSLTAVKNLSSLEIHPNVTFLLGENGSGKSTLLEAIAVAYGFNPEGGSKSFNFSTEDTHSELSGFLKISKGAKRASDGYFLRAESFYNVASSLDELDGGTGELVAAYGGVSLHQQSHGESFMSLIMNRFRGKGLYILDEPEAALSPSRQMALLARIHELVEKDSQFIIATHSPIILSYPNARVYDIENNFALVGYQDTEHYRLYKGFLDNPDGMHEILFD